MPDLTAQMQAAIGDEPPLGFGPGDVIAAAHRTRRRRRRAGLAAVAGVAAAAAGTALALPALAPPAGAPASRGPASPAGHRPASNSPALSLAALTRTAATGPAAAFAVASPHASAAGLSAAQVVALTVRFTGVNLATVQVSVLPPSKELDLTAGLAVPGHPSLNIQVAPAHTMITSMPTCAALSDLSSGDGDGYYGPCAIRRLADGSILIQRSGKTASGGFTKAQAVLIRPDGSGVFAEDTNQAMITVRTLPTRKDGHLAKPALPPVVRVEPAVGAGPLASLVRALTALAHR